MTATTSATFTLLALVTAAVAAGMLLIGTLGCEAAHATTAESTMGAAAATQETAKLLTSPAAAAAAVVAQRRPKTILFMFLDDLGFWDSGINNPSAPTPVLASLVAEGLRLNRSYTFMYCSPTRRAFLSGRFPVSMGADQAPVCSNALPLEMTILPQKLAQAGYVSHFVGKGHLGYQTMDHLPVNRGWKSHVGYLAGAENYEHGNNKQAPGHDCPGKPARCYKDMWQGLAPGTTAADEMVYSTNYYTRHTVEIIKNHTRDTPAAPLFIYLAYQAVHDPYEEPPVWEQLSRNSSGGFWDLTYGSMLHIVDNGIGNVTQALRDTGRWNDTLLVVSADNGGIEKGNNHPLRGLKATPWEGGTRAAGFVGGGYLPQVLRGKTSNRFISVADWYPTFCALAGVDPRDDVYLENKVRPIDGINVWTLLTGPATLPHPRTFMPVTSASIIAQERWKLLTGAFGTIYYGPNDTHTPDGVPCLNASDIEEGGIDTGRAPDYVGAASSEFFQYNLYSSSVIGAVTVGAADSGADDGAVRTEVTTTAPKAGKCVVCSVKKPCLFDLQADPTERVNLAATHTDIVAKLMAAKANFGNYINAKMNASQLADYNCITDISQWWGNFSGPCCRRK